MVRRSTRSGSTPARATASFTTNAPNSVAANGVSAPWNFPIGVRTALRITACFMFSSLSTLKSNYRFRPLFGQGTPSALPFPRQFGRGAESIPIRGHPRVAFVAGICLAAVLR